MTDRQTQIAFKILQYLSDNNNYEREGNVESFILSNNPDDMEFFDDYLHVLGSLVKDYRLIRKEKAELHLTPDGEAAQRIGFDKYLNEIKTGKQLELTLKRLDVLSNLLSIIRDSKTLVFIIAGVLGGCVIEIARLLGLGIIPIIKRIFELFL